MSPQTKKKSLSVLCILCEGGQNNRNSDYIVSFCRKGNNGTKRPMKGGVTFRLTICYQEQILLMSTYLCDQTLFLYLIPSH